MRFRGVAHVHSTFSFDGQLSLDQLARFVSGKGIDFVLMSEHVESLDPGKLAALIDECRRVSTDKLLVIPGVEIDALHVLFYNVSPVLSWQDETDLATQLAASGAMVVVSHPVKIRHGLPAAVQPLVEGVEIWNTRHDGKMAADPAIVSYWRSLQHQFGRNLSPLCGIDFHGFRDFTPVALEIESNRLDASAVLHALRRRHQRISAFGKTVPLNFDTARLAAGYRLYSAAYRIVYRLVYGLYHGARGFGLRMPKPLKSLAQRVF